MDAAMIEVTITKDAKTETKLFAPEESAARHIADRMGERPL